jgi:Domain of unknown function (DUF4276)
VKVVVYVEGPGDRACLETLLHPLIEAKVADGISIRFVPMTRGDRKSELLHNTPMKAANAILNDPEIVIVILPDLYPPNKVFPHTTCEAMQGGTMTAFRVAVARKHAWDERFLQRFHVFCMIHDLEVLLLAAEEALLAEAGWAEAPWTRPPEEQNHHQPPKRIVEALIPGYESTVDGPRILANVDYRTIAGRCPNGFGRFVQFLESLIA